jgi:hypothetical protein
VHLAAIAEEAAAAVHEHDCGAVVERRHPQVAEHLARPRWCDHDGASTGRPDARGGRLDVGSTSGAASGTAGVVRSPAARADSQRRACE